MTKQHRSRALTVNEPPSIRRDAGASDVEPQFGEVLNNLAAQVGARQQGSYEMRCSHHCMHYAGTSTKVPGRLALSTVMSVQLGS